MIDSINVMLHCEFDTETQHGFTRITVKNHTPYCGIENNSRIAILIPLYELIKCESGIPEILFDLVENDTLLQDTLDTLQEEMLDYATERFHQILAKQAIEHLNEILNADEKE